MTQLIIGGVALPQTSHDKYKAYEQPLTEQLTMCNGRMVEEVRGTVWIIEYSYDYMGNALMRSLLSVLRAGGAIQVSFLSDNSDALQSSKFLCTKLPEATFAFGRNNVPYWHDVAFELREADPHA